METKAVLTAPDEPENPSYHEGYRNYFDKMVETIFTDSITVGEVECLHQDGFSLVADGDAMVILVTWDRQE